MRATVLTVVIVAAACGQQVIDVHVSAEWSGNELTREWAAAGIVGGVRQPPPLKPAAETKPQAANVVSCAAIDDKADIGQIEAGLKERRLGCLKVYLGYVHRYASDPVYKPFYALAAKYDVPVVFHTGDTSSKLAKLKYADPLTVDEVAVDHPSTTFVLAHCGNPWIQSAAEVAYKNPNVYLECSALLAGDLSKMPPEKVDTYVVQPIAWIFGYLEDPSKLMFGSGWPLTKPGPYLDAYKKAIPKQYWPQVFHDNAARIFKLRPR
jgi:predicted TIM-barrel fold metal-dependent hydrolase